MNLTVTNPYNEKKIAEVKLATKSDVENAIKKAVSAFDETKRLPNFTRSKILSYVSKK